MTNEVNEMVYKPELLVTAADVAEARLLLQAGADAIIVGEDRFGMRVAGNFSLDKITEVVSIANDYGACVYVSMTNLITNELLSSISNYVKSIEKAGVKAVEFNDPAVLYEIKRCAPTLRLHWNGEMTTTNYATANYWGTKGAHRAVFARELNMEEIIQMKHNLQVESQVQVHGITNIYHSKRKLVQSYMAHQGQHVSGHLGKERGLFLVEAERKREKFPIFEDINGTHIMSSEDICILEDVHLMLEAGVNSFKVEGLLKCPLYNEAVVRAYRRVIDEYITHSENYEFQEKWLEDIRKLQNPERELSFGFFYKEQVY